MEVFISGLPRSIKGNVTASKPQSLEEAINIAQRLMDHIIKSDSVQEANDRKRKLEDKGNIIRITITITTITMITTTSRTGSKKPSRLILPPMGILEIDIMRISAQKQIIRPQESILRDELAFVHFRIPTLETTLEDIQVSSESSSI
ncbi:hypothetical protein Tco_1345963 [Tanacetum coccineum]